MCRNLYILYHLLSQRLFQCTCLCWNQFNKWCCVGVYYSSTALFFICRFYGMTGSCGAGIYIAQKCLPPPFFMHKNICPPLFPPPPPPSPVINDRSLMAAWVCAMCYTFQANAPAYKRTRPWVRGCKRTSVLPNLVPWACDPREGTWGSGIIRFREESDWPLIWNAQFDLSQDSWLPATDYPRASRSFPRITGSGNEIAFCHKACLHLQFLLRFLVRFSSAEGCERVDELRMFGVHVP
jgi:hypothetical protein